MEAPTSVYRPILLNPTYSSSNFPGHFSSCALRVCSYGFFTYVGSNQPDVPPGDGYRPYGTLVQGNVFDTWHMGKLKQADFTTVTGTGRLGG